MIESSDDYIYLQAQDAADDLSITKIDRFGNRLWTEDIDNTSDIIPADLCISNMTLFIMEAIQEDLGYDPFDYSCLSIDTNMNVNWIKHYANPRGYSLNHIRNELYGIKSGTGWYIYVWRNW